MAIYCFLYLYYFRVLTDWQRSSDRSNVKATNSLNRNWFYVFGHLNGVNKVKKQKIAQKSS
jgi:hypothetical protein